MLVLSRTRGRRASRRSAAPSARTGSGWDGVGGGRVSRPAPGLTKVSNSPLSSSWYWWPAPEKASFFRNLEKRPSTMVSGRRPLAQPPVPPAAAPA